MGVTITFIDKYKPEQLELLGIGREGGGGGGGGGGVYMLVS